MQYKLYIMAMLHLDIQEATAQRFYQLIKRENLLRELGEQKNTIVRFNLYLKSQMQVLSHYRPISCCSVLYKNHFKTPDKQIASHYAYSGKFGLTTSRQILDNVLLASELIKGYGGKSLSPRSMIEIDLKKAYDSVEWPFLFGVMNNLGMRTRFINWVMECVSQGSYVVQVNERPTAPFQANKGLRQGHPLSPFLIWTMHLNPSFSHRPSCKRVRLTHLIFANDLQLFCKAKKESIRAILHQFNKFSSSFGLEPNPEKQQELDSYLMVLEYV